MRLLVFQYSYQSLLFSETVDKLLSRFLDLHLKSSLHLKFVFQSHETFHVEDATRTQQMLASYTSGQPSNPRRHPTCWASSQWSHTTSRTPCHGTWTCSTQSSPVHRVLLHGASNRDTHLYSPHSNSSASLTTTAYVQWADHQWNAEWADNPTRLCTLIPDTGTHQGCGAGAPEPVIFGGAGAGAAFKI